MPERSKQKQTRGKIAQQVLKKIEKKNKQTGNQGFRFLARYCGRRNSRPHPTIAL